MAIRPDIHEIFSKQAQWTNKPFKYEEQESKQEVQLSKKTVMAPQPPMKKKAMAPEPPMKKFGGYVPKILSDTSDIIEIKDNRFPVLNSEVAPNTLGVVDSDGYLVPSFPPLTNIKPWIIGDKNTPMVLGYASDVIYENENSKLSGDENNNNNADERGQIHIYETVIQNDREDNNDYKNQELTIADTIILNNEQRHVVSYQNDNNIALDATTFDRSQNQLIGEPDVYIPPPDYDEDEQTLDFKSEIDEDVKGNPQTAKLKPVLKVYDGEDLSHFLKDDDPAVEKPVVLRNGSRGRTAIGRIGKSDILKPTSVERNSIFKRPGIKQKNKANGTVSMFNNVRTFSYADSKLAAHANVEYSKTFSVPNVKDEGEIFLRANTLPSSCELFARSRHEDSFYQETNGSEAGAREDDQSPQFQNKENALLKKLALRLKESVHKTLRLK